MHKRFSCWVLVAVNLFAITNFLHAQNYTLTPGDSIVAEIVPGDLSVFNFLQENTSADSLYLSWEKVSDEVPFGWVALICDNSNCYADLKQEGEMLPVIPGEYGLMSLHITAHDVAGTAIIRYAIWETNIPLVRDTLTWVIHSINTGIDVLKKDDFFIFTSGDQLVIRSTFPFHGKVKLLNLQGSLCASSNFSGLHQQFFVGMLPSGIYLLELSGNSSGIHKKILIEQ